MAGSRAQGGREPLTLLRSKIESCADHLVIALSGGRDSLALLAACVQLRDQGALGARRLRAIHIDHGLQAESPQWARACRRIARAWRVPLSVRRVSVTLARGQSLEAEARRHRYAAFAELLRAKECLLTAHHLDDQAETLLLQLLRGAGVRGLAAMPEETALGRGRLLRPWLEVPRAQLTELLKSLQISEWIEDPSNRDLRFDRNYLRANLMPALLSRWPSAHGVIARSAKHLGEARELLDELAAADLAALVPRGATNTAVIDVPALCALSTARQRNVLRYWLHAAGLRLPDVRHLERIRCELPLARRDAQPVVRWAGGEVRRFGNKLYALAPRPERDPLASAPLSLPWHWRVGQPISLGRDGGCLRLERDAHGPLHRASLPAELWIRTRVGGESIAVQGGEGRRRIKALLREARILPWWREQVPLVGAGSEVIAVGDLFVARAYRSTGDEPARERLKLIWERPEGWMDSAR